ncbi:MAG: TraR/DksA family transcriptional regulator [Fibrobacterota bacterium]
MKQAKRQEVAALIAEEIADITTQITQLEEASRPVSPDQSLGRLTRMDALASKSVNEAGLAAARQLLSRLQQAQNSVDNEDFGCCKRCDREISLERLRAVPYTGLCRTCM